MGGGERRWWEENKNIVADLAERRHGGSVNVHEGWTGADWLGRGSESSRRPEVVRAAGNYIKRRSGVASAVGIMSCEQGGQAVERSRSCPGAIRFERGRRSRGRGNCHERA